MQPSPASDTSYFQAKFQPVAERMQRGIDDGVAPGMVLLVAKKGETVFLQSFGTRAAGDETTAPPLSIDTVYDIAALTNVVITTTLIMKLVEGGKVSLHDRVSRYLQGFGALGKSPITIAQLLSHTSGLINWVPFFEELVKANAGARMGVVTSRGAKDHIMSSIYRSQPKHTPGTKQAYSDVGFILLGHLIELMTGLSLDRAAHKYVLQPLGMKSSSYIDLSMIKRRGIHPVTDLIAPTEECAWRKRVLCGEVHDDNAWVMGGVAGNAGLFSTALDLHLFTREILAAYHGSSNYLKRETIHEFLKRPMDEASVGWRHGWDSPSKENDMDDSKLSQDAFGMCGFTGCSIWIEPSQKLEIILMSNRINPSRSNRKIQSFRPEIHDAVLAAADGL